MELTDGRSKTLDVFAYKFGAYWFWRGFVPETGTSGHVVTAVGVPVGSPHVGALQLTMRSPNCYLGSAYKLINYYLCYFHAESFYSTLI